MNTYRLNDYAYGVFWFPLIFFGAPGSKITGIADVDVTLMYNQNVIKFYQSRIQIQKWTGLYRNTHVYKLDEQNNLAFCAMRYVMDDIKQQLLNDKEFILNAIR